LHSKRIFYFIGKEMIKKYLFVTMLLALSVVSAFAQTAQNNADTIMILPFENASGKSGVRVGR
jgi:hypothetical protein